MPIPGDELLNFEVMGRDDLMSAAPMRVPYAVISIRDPGRRPAKIRQSGLCRGVLRLAFHDAEPTRGFALPPGVRLLTDDDANAIRDFIAAHRGKIDALVVHCEQGMSRSPAVAAAVALVVNGDNKRFFRDYSPNMHVYRAVLSALTAQRESGV